MVSRVVVGRTIGIVAILGVLFSLWVYSLVSRTRDYREQAQYHADEELSERRNIEAFDSPKSIQVKGVGELEVDSTLRKSWREASRLRVAYHADLKRKYERAARRPWLGVEPDPDDPGSALMFPSSLPYMVDDVKYLSLPTAAPTDPAVQPAVAPTP